ncbi:MAG: pilus assembly protein PilP [Candidatus Binatia bacterium]
MMRGLRILLAGLALAWVDAAHAQEAAPAAGETVGGDAGVAAAQPPLLRDPFRPFTMNMRTQAPIHITPLQRFEIGQLTLVATVWEMNPPRALVEDSAGMGYVITLGTPIGPNGGVVKAIEPLRVMVEERVLDFYGTERINRVVMETPKDEPNQAGRERE